jgi:hypothetical protein
MRYRPCGTYRPNERVIFAHPQNGNSYDQEQAEKLLKVGQIYTARKVEVGGWHTDVTLAEIPDKQFNSVLFDSLYEKEELTQAADTFVEVAVNLIEQAAKLPDEGRANVLAYVMGELERLKPEIDDQTGIISQTPVDGGGDDR